MYKKYKLDETKKITTVKLLEFRTTENKKAYGGYQVKKYDYATFTYTKKPNVFDILFLTGKFAGRLYENVEVVCSNMKVDGNSYCHVESVELDGYIYNEIAERVENGQESQLAFDAGVNSRIIWQLGANEDEYGDKLTLRQLQGLCDIKNVAEYAATTKKAKEKYEKQTSEHTKEDELLKEKRQEFEELLDNAMEI